MVGAELQVFSCALQGQQHIEASAGTGKTWNICALVLRLLLEQDLPLERILVVTYTNAATAELRERIRGRLVETQAHLEGRAAEKARGKGRDDPFVPQLLQALRTRAGLDDDTLARRLRAALATFDDAAILTIHGFCQRALADAPFTAGVPLAQELLSDDREILEQVVRDFWRRHIVAQGLDSHLAAWLTHKGDSPERWVPLLERHLAHPLARSIWPSGMDAADAPDPHPALQAAHAAARAAWAAGRAQAVAAVRAGVGTVLNGNKVKGPEKIEQAALAWDALLASDSVAGVLAIAPDSSEDKLVALMSSQGLQAATKKNCAPPAHPFFDAAQRVLDARDAAASVLVRARLRLIRRMLEEGKAEVHALKRAQRVVSFDDMLGNLHKRLQADAALATALRRRYAVALIDEFQDTDPLQYAIFRQLHGQGQMPLFLVGDPKQAIYRFRQADLHTYLRARGDSDAVHTLLHNQRSVEPLLRGLNALLGANPGAFMMPGLSYHAVSAGPRQRDPLHDPAAGGQAGAALQLWWLDNHPASGLARTSAQAREDAAAATAAEIARLLGAGSAGTGEPGERARLGTRPLGGGDIAVLVRSHADGSLIRRALARLGVGSVELARTSVLATAEAQELECVLAGVLEPANAPRVRAALATTLMGVDAAGLQALAADEAGWLERAQAFARYREAWQSRGVGLMLRRWMQAEEVAARLLAQPDGERRMTNLLHLVECLEEAAQDHPSPDALLRWLQQQRTSPAEAEERQLRLESDQDLVQIVTIHKSKGLEYPVVFCPFLWKPPRTDRGLSDGVASRAADGTLNIDWRTPLTDPGFDPDVLKRALREEEAAETIRLVYVALTRAIHRCVLVAGNWRKDADTQSTGSGQRNLLNWLVAGAGHEPADWIDAKYKGLPEASAIQARWQALAAAGAPDISLQPLPVLRGVRLARAHLPADHLAACPAPGTLPPPWRIGSYSGLVHGATHEQAAADRDLRVPQAAAEARQADAPATDILHFARGPRAGECLHTVFEHADFTDPATWPAAVTQALTAFGPHEAVDAQRLQGLLRDVVQTPLPVGTESALRLCTLPRARRLDELEFHLPAARLDTDALVHTLARHRVQAPALRPAVLRGYLKGFIDLVFEHEGRWFVLDWKSNHLGWTREAYGPGAVAAEAQAQGYELQALLYQVALDRLLRRRLRGYDPARHLGGGLVAFVRGLRPSWQLEDGSPAGLHHLRPAPALVQELGALFEEGAP